MPHLATTARFVGLILVVLGPTFAGVFARAENWPAWRGPTGMGVSTETDLSLAWSTTENIRWQVKLPFAGNSTPVIWGDRVFLTQASEVKQWPPKVPENYAGGASAGGFAIAEKRSLMCFSRTSGELLWQKDVLYKEPEITHSTNPFCSASPVTDGERVIVSHGPAGLACYDFEGKELWRYDVGKIEHLWGTASSPILYKDLCIQWCGPGNRQFLVALNKKTGEKIWETPEEGGDDGITSKKFLGSWSTPLIARVGEEDQLIFPVPFKLKGYDPNTGKELWSARGPGTYCYHSPLFVDGLAIFGRDLVKLGGRGDISKDRMQHGVGAMFISTATIAGDYLYTYNDAGVPSCYEWATGADIWKGQFDKRPGGKAAWGSPIFAAGRIYITDRDGTTSVFRAGPKYELLSLNPLKEHCDASIAVSQGNLFIRTHKQLWCIGPKN